MSRISMIVLCLLTVAGPTRTDNLEVLDDVDGAAPREMRLHLISVGRVGPPSLHATALEPDLFVSVSWRHCLGSWASVLRTPMATNQFENVVHGALKTYDLPDLLATLPKKKVTVAEPLDPTEQPLTATE